MEAKSQSQYLATVPGKKDDPSYAAVRGHVPKELYKRFRLYCLEREVDNSQGLEDLLKEFFEYKDSLNGSNSSDPTDLPGNKLSKGKG